MPISNINRVKSIVLPLPPNNGDIIPIYQNNKLTLGSEFLPGYDIVSYNCFIKNLKAYATIRSLEAATPPKFELTDSDTDKLYKTLDVEWKSPRKQLMLYISVGDEWAEVGAVALLNPYGYPYRIYNLMDLFTDNLAIELGDNSKIGIQVQAVGYGLLDPNDKVTVHGSYVEEFFVYSKDATTYPVNSNSGSGGASQQINSFGNSFQLDNKSLIGN